jgi:hypothetical protein
MSYIPPYNFVPVDVEACEKKEPVWHDVFPQSEKYSGRIRCTAYALTPMIAGNEQVAYENLSEEEQKEVSENARAKVGVRIEKVSVSHDHKLVRPFRFPDEQLGISGHTLTGLFANVYAAITNSPVERVNDRTFSFRPNVAFPPNGMRNPPGPQPYAGILLANGTGYSVLTFPVQRPEFAKVTSVPAVTAWLASASVANFSTWLRAMPALTDIVLPCGGGLDGDGELQRAFSGSNYAPCNQQCLRVDTRKLMALTAADILPLSGQVLEGFERTVKHLATDHLENHPQLSDDAHRKRVRAALSTNRSLRPGAIVFVEVLKGKIVTIGMNFRYRWCFENSFTRYALDASLKNGTLRPLFDLRSEQAKPRSTATLSPRRRLFGFVDPKPDDADENALIAFAGRVKVSCAIHEPETGERKPYVPLKVLGSPKTSAYEFYLSQNASAGKLKDYGEPGNPHGAGEPRGRKFYLHQPEAAWEPRRYRIQLDESPQENWGRIFQTAEMLVTPRLTGAGIKRFPTFRFTVLFENLDEDELSNLLLAVGLGNRETDFTSLENTPERLQNSSLYAGDNIPLAHKIGHAQPLGLGSLLTRIDAVERIQVNEQGQPQWSNYDKRPTADALPAALAAVAAFRPAENIQYPLAPDRGGNLTIHNFHTAVHIQQGRVRRGHRDSPSDFALRTAEEAHLNPINEPT